LLFFSIIHHHTHTTNSSSLYKNKKGVSAENRHSDRPAQCQVCNNKKPKALVKRKGVQIWMCKPCAVETNDLFASVGTVNIDTLAAVASLDPGAAAPLPTPPEWTGTIDMRHLPQLPQLPPLPTPPPPSSSSIESESDSLPSPKDIPLPRDAADLEHSTDFASCRCSRLSITNQTVYHLCETTCQTSSHHQVGPKHCAVRQVRHGDSKQAASEISIDPLRLRRVNFIASNAELAAMANATAAGAATLKRVNNKVCQRCNQNQALLKANMGTRVVILCELCVADVREHRLARFGANADRPLSTMWRCRCNACSTAIQWLYVACVHSMLSQGDTGCEAMKR
jgi:ribosomal protein L37AE/L43A